MLSKTEIFEVLTRLMVKQFDFREDEVVLTAHIVDDLDLDSIDAIDLAVQIEEEIGVRLDEDQLKSIRLFEDIVDAVHRGQSAESA